MNSHIVHSAKYPIKPWALWKRDFLMISAFGIWTAALGLLPVFLFNLLIRSIS